MDQVSKNNCLDKNIFLDSQLDNDQLTWKLLYQKSISSQTSAGTGDQTRVNNSPWDQVLLIGLIKDNTIQVSVNNEFDNNAGGIGEAVSGVRDTAQKYVDMVSLARGGVNDIIKGISGWFSEGSKDANGNPTNELAVNWNQMTGANVLNGTDKGGWGVGFADKLDRLTKGAQLMVGTDYIKMYKGTNISYNIPDITARIYEGVYYSAEDTVRSKLTELIDVLTGQFNGLANIATTQDGYNKNLNNLFGAMTAPNGYVPSFDNIGTDNNMTGTFWLKYGDYTYKNLLVQGYNITLSTFKVMGKDGKVTKMPLYADISLSFIPANFITGTNLKNFLMQNV